MSMKFENPPINEIIIGLYFESPINELRTEHIGLLWSKWRDKLPTVEQRPSIITDLHPRVTISNETDLLERFWFVSDDSARLVQIQRDAFIHNGRRIDSDYPKYSEQMKPNFDHYYSMFESFVENEVRESMPKIRTCELTYIDTIDTCEYWGGAHDTAKVIPSLTESLRIFSDKPAIAINNSSLFKLNSNTNLRLAIQTTSSTNGSEESRLVIELRAQGFMGGVQKSATESWFTDAHESIISWFVSLTSDEIQRNYWKRRA